MRALLAASIMVLCGDFLHDIFCANAPDDDSYNASLVVPHRCISQVTNGALVALFYHHQHALHMCPLWV